MTRFSFDCFKKFLVRLARKVIIGKECTENLIQWFAQTHFVPLLKMEGRKVRTDIIQTLYEFLLTQPMVDFMTVLMMVLGGDVFQIYTNTAGVTDQGRGHMSF